MSEDNIWVNIVNELTKKEYTIATMESCTGGGIANEITNISGASLVIKESYVTYCNEAKIKQGVSKDIIEKYSVYSKEVGVEMAKTAKKQANADFGIGVTGQLGRIDLANPVDKLNTVWYAITNNNDELIVKELQVPDENRNIQKKFIINEIAKSIMQCLI